MSLKCMPPWESVPEGGYGGLNLFRGDRSIIGRSVVGTGSM